MVGMRGKGGAARGPIRRAFVTKSIRSIVFYVL